MLVKIALLTKHDNTPGEDFPHETSWVSPTAGTLRQVRGDKLYEYGRTESDLQIDIEGLRSPAHGGLLVAPPKYPPLRAERRPCDSSVLAKIQAKPGYMILAVDDIGNGVPPAAEDMGWDEAIAGDKWVELRAGILAVTPAEHDVQVGNALDQWRSGKPDGTPAEFVLALRRFTS